MIGWLFLAFGIALGVSLAPVFSVELFVISLASTTAIPWLLIGASVAVGQVAGKSVYYFGARGSIRLPGPLHRNLQHRNLHKPRKPASSIKWQRWRAARQRIHGWFDRLRARCQRHPYWLGGTYGVSSVLGLPPFMATTILAGMMRMRPSVFLTTGLIGRFVRFSIIAAAPGLVTAWLPL